MTRILPLSGAGLAHYQSRPNQNRTRWEQAGTAQRTETRHHGNRRMGDRRSEDRRGMGRRASDRVSHQTASSWITASLSAHLIGQAEGQKPTLQMATRAYASAGQPVRGKAGGLI